MDVLRVTDLGRMSYRAAYEVQCQRLDELLAARSHGARIGDLLLVEHDPVITVTARPGARGHVLVDAARLATLGVEVCPTDRGGDVTYHGPGQLVAYPIVDLNRLNCRLVDYLRSLESVVIATLAGFGVRGERDSTATGVWADDGGGTLHKVCAIGVRVRRWITMHGLAINLDPDLAHFGLIVPCGLHGRPVTSLRRLLGDSCPPMAEVKSALSAHLGAVFAEMAARADERRADQGAASVPGGIQR
jgi:lipoyl(octanoyl) transferase